MNQNNLELNLSKAPSKALAAQVVAYKVLGFNKQQAIRCMEELFRRKSQGDEFDYESYIEENVKKMPKPQPIDLKAVQGMLNLKNLSSIFKK